MSSPKTSLVVRTAAFAASVALASSIYAYDTYTVTFQQGVNGYSGELDRVFASNTDNSSTRGNTKGGSGPSGGRLSMDGYNGTDSPDQQVFLRFNNIIGSGAGQIPANAFVLDASLSLKTATSSESSSANSGGPIGVGAVLVNWNTSTSTYNTLKPAGSPENGLSANYGVITPAVGFYDDPAVLYGGSNGLTFDTRYSANVAPLVRAWANGTMPNYGFTIHGGAPAATTDAWQIKVGSYATVADRPVLSVTYTNAPVQTATFQQGVNGYNGTTMSWVRLIDDTATDGSGKDNAFLDGYQDSFEEDNISSDDHALIKFNNLFQGQGGSVPDHAVIVKATLVLTTGVGSNAQTGQPYQAHQMLRDWGTGTTWTDFNSDDGIRIGIDEGPMLSAQYGMIPQSQAQFDITQAVQNWQSGQSNYGIDIRATPPDPLWWGGAAGTSDGWSIYFTGAANASYRPELLVSYYVHIPGDANDDGVVNADDFALIDRGFAMHRTTWADGDFNYDGVVNSADYLIIDAAQPSSLSPAYLAMRQAQFGDAYVASLIAAVPEPATLGLLAAALPLALRRRRA